MLSAPLRSAAPWTKPWPQSSAAQIRDLENAKGFGGIVRGLRADGARGQAITRRAGCVEPRRRVRQELRVAARCSRSVPLRLRTSSGLPKVTSRSKENSPTPGFPPGSCWRRADGRLPHPTHGRTAANIASVYFPRARPAARRVRTSSSPAPPSSRATPRREHVMML